MGSWQEWHIKFEYTKDKQDKVFEILEECNLEYLQTRLVIQDDSIIEIEDSNSDSCSGELMNSLEKLNLELLRIGINATIQHAYSPELVDVCFPDNTDLDELDKLHELYG